MTTPLDIRRDGDVVILTLNRPNKLNALNAELLRQLCRAGRRRRRRHHRRTADTTHNRTATAR